MRIPFWPKPAPFYGNRFGTQAQNMKQIFSRLLHNSRDTGFGCASVRPHKKKQDTDCLACAVPSVEWLDGVQVSGGVLLGHIMGEQPDLDAAGRFASLRDGAKEKVALNLEKQGLGLAFLLGERACILLMRVLHPNVRNIGYAPSRQSKSNFQDAG